MPASAIAPSLDQGDTYPTQMAFRDSSEALVDPTVVRLLITSPEGVVEEREYPTGISKTSKGLYEAEIELTEPGRWEFTWSSEEPDTAETGEVNARRVLPRRRESYAEIDDVSAELPWFTITETGQPNQDDVYRFLEIASDDIDRALAKLGYEVPIDVSATESRTLLRGWTAVGAAMRTVAAMPQGEDSKHLKFLERRWAEIMRELKDEVVLPDVAKGSATTGRIRTGKPTGDPYFSRDEEP
jgi:hypothetical protein